MKLLNLKDIKERISKRFYFYLFFICCITTQKITIAQIGDGLGSDSVLGIIDTSLVRQCDFIRFTENRFKFYSDKSPSFERFFEKFDSLINFRKGQVVIYHFGGSHIQADIYSNRIRTYLNSFWPGIKGARGFVFPYTLANTNNPWNYRVNYNGDWVGHRCVVKKDTTRFGLSGMSASTHDTLSGFLIYYRDKEPMPYKHNRIRIYHNVRNRSYQVSLKNKNLVEFIEEDTIAGYTQFSLNKEIDSVEFEIRKVGVDTGSFYVYGVELYNYYPGVIYNSIGVNGAAFSNYLRCQDFEIQMKQLIPDLVIISIGTNDANVPAEDFKPEVYKNNYKQFIERIRNVNPNVAILLTVPNDAYYLKRYPNKNIAKQEEVIRELAKEYQYGVWDFYEIMGGFGSSQTWMKSNLMHRDRIHFTNDGYLLKGDLFFEAFLKYMEEFELKKLVKISHD